MTEEYRPIPTRYAGMFFRSKLEARWALCFDVLKMPWVYEMEGFDLAGVWYLPDFWLPEQCYWIEIKPPLPDGEPMPQDYVRRLMALSDFTEHDAIAIYGMPGRANIGVPPYRAFRFYPGREMDDGQLWCQCPGCGVIEMQFEGRWPRNNHIEGCPKQYTGKSGAYQETDMLLLAYEKAMVRDIPPDRIR